MKNLWINSFLILLFAVTPVFAFQAEEAKPDEPLTLESVRKKIEELSNAFDDNQQLREFISTLRALRPDLVHKMLDDTKLSKNYQNLFRGWAFHQQGEYVKASEWLGKVDLEQLKDQPYIAYRVEELMKTAEEMKDFAVLETENFSIRYKQGPDEVWLHYLPDIMERIYKAYSELFAFSRDEKIIVELMPDHQLFSYASALTRSQIETTGTIALCVENRLAVLTPRRVLQGYYWPDVIAHEFVHYILTKQSEDHVPLWMQEGMAKYFETRWEHERSVLEPDLESSMALAIKHDQLITVEQMMPSFAALPTPELARQAYAQTTTMIDYISKTHGEEVIRGIIVSLKDDDSMDNALQGSLGMDFATFESSWREWIKAQNYKLHDEVGSFGVSLLDSDADPEKISELEAEDRKHKKHMRLGDLLLERKRYRAALKQYEKLAADGKQLHRQVVLRMLSCYENLGSDEPIIKLIDGHVPELMNDVTMLVYKAEAHYELKRVDKAESLLQRAVRTNPYHPAIFNLLARIEEERGNQEAAQKMNELLELLTRRTARVDKDRKS